MKNILCFGDSNTWGYNGETGARYPYEKRWTSILEHQLGSEYNIIVEGLNGRTTVWEDPFSPCRNGSAALPYALLSHAPLDLIILMLGTNDTKNYYRNTAFSVGKGIRRLIEMIQASASGLDGKAPAVLLVSPALLGKGDPERAPFDNREFLDLDGHDPSAVAEGLAAEYERKAEEYGCYFLNAADYAEAGDADGVHLTEESHSRLGEAVASKIKTEGLL